MGTNKKINELSEENKAFSSLSPLQLSLRINMRFFFISFCFWKDTYALNKKKNEVVYCDLKKKLYYFFLIYYILNILVFYNFISKLFFILLFFLIKNDLYIYNIMPFNFFELGINFTQKVFTCYVSLRSHKLFNINKIYLLRYFSTVFIDIFISKT